MLPANWLAGVVCNTHCSTAVMFCSGKQSPSHWSDPPDLQSLSLTGLDAHENISARPGILCESDVGSVHFTMIPPCHRYLSLSLSVLETAVTQHHQERREVLAGSAVPQQLHAAPSKLSPTEPSAAGAR